jgi:hypothetical protein
VPTSDYSLFHPHKSAGNRSPAAPVVIALDSRQQALKHYQEASRVMPRTRIAVCGAGIAGIATAYFLATRYPRNSVLLIDKLQPMALTTSRSGENFRDYWPQPCMFALTGHSIDLMQELGEIDGNDIDLRFSGYEFVSEQSFHPGICAILPTPEDWFTPRRKFHIRTLTCPTASGRSSA